MANRPIQPRGVLRWLYSPSEIQYVGAENRESIMGPEKNRQRRILASDVVPKQIEFYDYFAGLSTTCPTNRMNRLISDLAKTNFIIVRAPGAKLVLNVGRSRWSQIPYTGGG